LSTLEIRWYTISESSGIHRESLSSHRDAPGIYRDYASPALMLKEAPGNLRGKLPDVA